MSLYVRLINKKNWISISKKEELCGEAITVDWNCQKNEWSVFRCEDSVINLEKNELLNKIALRMIADNSKKTKQGVDLLILDTEFVKDIQSNIDDEEEELIGCKHCNFKDINYKKIIKAINYTIKKKGNKFITYSIAEIRKLFLESSRDYLCEYTQYALKKSKDRLKEINKIFLKDKPGFFEAYIK